MYCKKCNNKIENGEKFCGKCGQKVEVEDNSNNDNVIKVKFNYIIYTIITIIIIVGLVALMQSIKTNSESVNTSNGLFKTNNKTAIEWNYTEKGTITDGNIELHIGDYVNYDEQTNAKQIEYTSPESKNGYGDQIFNLKKYEYGWRVLGIENSQLLLVSEDVIGVFDGFRRKGDDYDKTYYYLAGYAGYVNAKEELDNICILYGQGIGASGARSINREDINKITEFSTESRKPSDISKDSVEYELLFKNPKINSSINEKYKGEVAGCTYWLATTIETVPLGYKNYAVYSVSVGMLWKNDFYTQGSRGYITSKYSAGIRPVVYLDKYTKLVQLEKNKYDIET